jgi:hypothetical protein
MKLPNDLYATKLVFKKTAVKDSGIYLCAAFSDDGGIQYRGARLDVLQTKESKSKGLF